MMMTIMVMVKIKNGYDDDACASSFVTNCFRCCKLWFVSANYIRGCSLLQATCFVCSGDVR